MSIFEAFHAKQYIVPKKRIITKKVNRIGRNKAYQMRLVYKKTAYKIKRTSTDLVQQRQTITQQRYKKKQ